MTTEQITHGSWLEQELQLGGARHAVRAKPPLAIFQSVDAIYIASEASDTRHDEVHLQHLAPRPPELNVGIFPCAGGPVSECINIASQH